MKEIDLENWKRKATFDFFKDYEDPFFNMTANLDVTRLYAFCRDNDLSYSIACLFYSQITANNIREFRVRLVGDKFIEYDNVAATQTILQDNETFSFCHFQRADDVFEFNRVGKLAREKYLAMNTFDVETDRLDLIYYSVIPWVSFTSFKHASRFDRTQTVPRIVFGKFFDDGDRKKMPLSVEANHMIMDGIHVGKYFNQFQQEIDALQ